MNATQLMDKQYRHQRYIYDVSRRYYLLGRDSLLREISVRPGETVLEVGCGTARNLLQMAYRSPYGKFYGVDASSLMLEIAERKIASTLQGRNICLKQGLAERICPADFGLKHPFDHIVFSYVLSMLPDWQTALDNALDILKPGGQLHVVDFADQAGMPRWFRASVFCWLDWFGVRPEPTLPAHLQMLAANDHDQLDISHLYGRYALLAHYHKRGKSSPQPLMIPAISNYLDVAD